MTRYRYLNSRAVDEIISTDDPLAAQFFAFGAHTAAATVDSLEQ